MQDDPLTPTGIASSQEPSSTAAARARRWTVPALAGVGALLAIAVLLLFLLDFPRLFEAATARTSIARDLAHRSFEVLGTLPPFAFFGAMAVLCVFPVPVSAFYVAGTAIYGPGTALAWISGALAVNIWLGQTLASQGLRPFATRVLEARGIRIPQSQAGRDELWLVVLVRIAPGVPFFAQNLVLGLANVDRARSLAVSLPIQMVFACGFVWLGRSAFEGRLGTAVAAIGLIASVSIAARFLHRRLSARHQA